MSRVNRTENSTDQKRSDESRQAERGRQSDSRRDDSNPGHTATKAEGEEKDVDEALRHQ